MRLDWALWPESLPDLLNDGSVTFNCFRKNRYFPLQKGNLKEENRKKQEGLDPDEHPG